MIEINRKELEENGYSEVLIDSLCQDLSLGKHSNLREFFALLVFDNSLKVQIDESNVIIRGYEEYSRSEFIEDSETLKLLRCLYELNALSRFGFYDDHLYCPFLNPINIRVILDGNDYIIR